MEATTVVYILTFGAMIGGLIGFTIGHAFGVLSERKIVKGLLKDGILVVSKGGITEV